MVIWVDFTSIHPLHNRRAIVMDIRDRKVLASWLEISQSSSPVLLQVRSQNVRRAKY